MLRFRGTDTRITLNPDGTTRLQHGDPLDERIETLYFNCLDDALDWCEEHCQMAPAIRPADPDRPIVDRCKRCGSLEVEHDHFSTCRTCLATHDSEGELILPACDECASKNVVSQMNVALCYLGDGENGGYQTVTLCRPCSEGYGVGEDSIFGEVSDITRMEWWIAGKFINDRVDVWDAHREIWVDDCGLATHAHNEDVRVRLDGTGMNIKFPYHLVRFATTDFTITDTEGDQS